MTTITASIATAGLSALLLAAALTAQTTDGAGRTGAATAPATTAPSGEVSKIRIVRLSEVKGVVLLDRHIERGFETAVNNMPIVALSRLQTGDGLAEVEFEDNSTLRLAPHTLVEFPDLGRLAAGTTTSSVVLVKGMVYVSLLKTRGNEFNLLFGGQKLQLPPSSHVRLQVDGTEAKLAVLDGTVQIAGASGPVDVTKNKTVMFNLHGEDQPTVARNVTPYDELDLWDQKEAKYHAQALTASALSNSPYAYGTSDMAYYGDFMDAGGCGSMWRPYFASAAWDPYSNGAWAWYAGAGYSWVSPYPWGWTPYHYGSWSYCPGVGYGWLPGGAWNGLNNIASGPVNGPVNGPINGPGRLPIRPLRPPLAGEPALTVVSLKPLVRSEATSDDSFVLRKDSAGMGVPRDGLGNLNKLSQRTLDRGTTTRDTYGMSGPFAPNENGRPNGTYGSGNSNRQESSRPSEPTRPYESAPRSTTSAPSQMGTGGSPSGGGAPSGSSPSSGSAPSAGRGH